MTYSCAIVTDVHIACAQVHDDANFNDEMQMREVQGH